MVTVRWLSAAVKKIWLFFVGMTVLRVMSLVMTPPTVSMPSVSGLTSSSTRSVSASSQIGISEVLKNYTRMLSHLQRRR